MMCEQLFKLRQNLK